MSNMAYSLSFHNEAENDFDAIYNWYESQDIKLAERFSAQLDTKLGQILEAPETYGAKSKKGYREATLKTSRTPSSTKYLLRNTSSSSALYTTISLIPAKNSGFSIAFQIPYRAPCIENRYKIPTKYG